MDSGTGVVLPVAGTLGAAILLVLVLAACTFRKKASAPVTTPDPESTAATTPTTLDDDTTLTSALHSSLPIPNGTQCGNEEEEVEEELGEFDDGYETFGADGNPLEKPVDKPPSTGTGSEDAIVTQAVTHDDQRDDDLGEFDDGYEAFGADGEPMSKDGGTQRLHKADDGIASPAQNTDVGAATVDHVTSAADVVVAVDVDGRKKKRGPKGDWYTVVDFTKDGVKL